MHKFSLFLKLNFDHFHNYFPHFYVKKSIISKNILVTLGEEGWDHYHDTIECYDPNNDKWEIVGEMGSSRSWLSCVGLTVKMESGATGEEKS